MVDPAILALFKQYNSLIVAAWQYDGVIGAADYPNGKMMTKSRDLFAKADAAKAAFLDALGTSIGSSIPSRLQDTADEMKKYQPNCQYFDMITVTPDKFRAWIKSIEDIRKQSTGAANTQAVERVD